MLRPAERVTNGCGLFGPEALVRALATLREKFRRNSTKSFPPSPACSVRNAASTSGKHNADPVRKNTTGITQAIALVEPALSVVGALVSSQPEK